MAQIYPNHNQEEYKLAQEKRTFLLHNNVVNYVLIAVLGIVAGLLTAFFSYFTYYDLWSFSSFSSMSLGFWVFTIAIIVLKSERWSVAGVNTSLYVFFLFFVNNLHKILRGYSPEFIDTANLVEDLGNIIPYCLETAIFCGGLGIILYIGVIEKWYGKIMVMMPAIFIIIEAVIMYYMVFTKQMLLFQAILDTVCVFLYICIFRKLIFRRKNKNKENQHMYLVD